MPGFMRLYAQTRGFNLGRPAAARPTPDGKTVLFLRALPNKPSLMLFAFDVATAQTRMLMTPEQLLNGAEETLSVEEKARRERMRITVGGFTSYELSEDGTFLLVPLSGRLFTLHLSNQKVTELPVGKGVLDPHLSPTGKHASYVRDNTLWVMDLATRKERAVTPVGTPLKTYGLAEFVAQEEMGRMRGHWWSPDGQALLFEEADSTGVEEFHIQDPMHPEVAPVAFRYPRAGKANAVVRLGITSIKDAKVTWLKWDAVNYPYVAVAQWKNNAPPVLLVQDRRQRQQLLLAAAPKTCATQTLLAEKDDAWLNIRPDMPRWLEDGSAFLWATERNGAWELEVHNKDGSLRHTLLDVNSGLRDVVDVDDKAGTVTFLSGVDPLSNVLQRVPLTGGAPVTVGQEEGTRSVTFGKSHDVFVESRASAEAFRTVEVRRGDGTLLGPLPSIHTEPPFRPNVRFLKVGDGAGFYAAVVLPRSFDTQWKYPVILDVYGGPHHNTVVGVLDMYLRAQWLADHGYIVVSVDGRGTPLRGRAWERAIVGDFSVIPLQDQVSGLKHVLKKFPQADSKRVGVMGWSFGGTMAALAVLKRPDVFQTAVSGAPVVDWQDYDTHYTERYLGLPDENPQGYTQSNLMTHAKDLERPLLLIHGTADDNVYFFHSLKLSNALFRAGKPHTVLPLSGFTHMVPEPAVTEKLWERMVGHLSETLHPTL